MNTSDSSQSTHKSTPSDNYSYQLPCPCFVEDSEGYLRCKDCNEPIETHPSRIHTVRDAGKRNENLKFVDILCFYCHHSGYMNFARNRQILLNDSGKVFQEYNKCALILKDDDTVQSLADKIRRFYASDDVDNPSPRHFFAVGGPSGSGKTQFAFNLRARGLDVWHVCLAPEGGRGSEEAQTIYRHPSINTTSVWLLNAIRKDLYNYDHNRIGNISATALLDQYFPLHTVCCFGGVFGVHGAGGAQIATCMEFRRALSGLTTESLPVLYVDEAFQKSLMYVQEDFRSLEIAMFLRTVARACGVACVFAGTSADMVDFATMRCGHSRSRGGIRFAEFVGILPRTVIEFNLESVRSIDTRRFLTVLRDNFPRCNPLLMTLLHQASQELDETSTLDQVVDAAAVALYRDKRTLLSPAGIMSQSFYLRNSLAADSSILVNHHFARFSGDYIFVLSGTRVGYEVPGYVEPQYSKPPCMFPQSETDPLIGLLLGGAVSSPFRPVSFEFVGTVACRLTSAAAHVLSTCYVSARSIQNPTYSPNARKCGGDALECLAVLAAVNASRVSGVRGCCAEDFLRAFLLEMSPVASNDCGEGCLSQHFEIPTFRQSVSLESVWSLGASQIPFLTRLDDEFPSSLQGCGGLFVGKICRPPDAQQIDASITYENQEYVTIEAKTHSSAVDIGRFREILVRFEKRAAVPLGIVVVSALAEFQGGLGAIDEELFKDMNIVKMFITEGSIVISPLRKIVEPRARLVVVVEADEVQMKAHLIREFPQLCRDFYASSVNPPEEKTRRWGGRLESELLHHMSNLNLGDEQDRLREAALHTQRTQEECEIKYKGW